MVLNYNETARVSHVRGSIFLRRFRSLNAASEGSQCSPTDGRAKICRRRRLSKPRSARRRTGGRKSVERRRLSMPRSARRRTGGRKSVEGRRLSKPPVLADGSDGRKSIEGRRLSKPSSARRRIGRAKIGRRAAPFTALQCSSTERTDEKNYSMKRDRLSGLRKRRHNSITRLKRQGRQTKQGSW